MSIKDFNNRLVLKEAGNQLLYSYNLFHNIQEEELELLKMHSKTFCLW